MDFFSIIKQLSDLGMVGLSLAVACGLAYVIFQREKDGMIQLKGAIDALTVAITEVSRLNAQTSEFLDRQAKKSENDVKELAADLKSVKGDIELMKHAMVSVGMKTFTEKRNND